MPVDSTKIQITVRLHAILRNVSQGDGGNLITLELPAQAIVGDVRRALGLPQMELVFSLNAAIVDEQAPLKSGDVVDVIPAISGGSPITPEENRGGLTEESRICSHPWLTWKSSCLPLKVYSRNHEAKHGYNCCAGLPGYQGG